MLTTKTIENEKNTHSNSITFYLFRKNEIPLTKNNIEDPFCVLLKQMKFIMPCNSPGQNTFPTALLSKLIHFYNSPEDYKS